jgi:hypothetical protein
MTFQPMLSAEMLLKRTYDRAYTFWRDNSPAGRVISRKRATTDEILNSLGRATSHRFEGTVLVDAMWDNPNYWLRFSLLRAALGLARGREVALLGEFRRRQCRETLCRLGIATVESFPDVPVLTDTETRAAELAAVTHAPEEILAWKLPESVSSAIVYDGILKRQRLAAVDVQHPLFKRHTDDALRAIEQSRYLLDKYNPDLIVLSHPFNFSWGSLAWQALSRGMPVVLLWALFGNLRFTRLRTVDELFRFYDRPNRKEIDALTAEKADALAAIGRQYLKERFNGRAGDLQAIYAYSRASQRVDRTHLCECFGWDRAKPIVGFYASNWYDWPHQLGMTQFRDFLDWTQASVAAANKNDRVNWLFKPHPCEDWFGGTALADILADAETRPHVAVCDKSWSNAEVMRSIDMLVTYHGTAGIEFASMGKPVLVPDRGKYDDCGFAKLAQTREHYIELLATDWWDDIDLVDSQRRAEIFSGWWMCSPDWQGKFVMSEDFRQDELYDIIPSLLAASRGEVEMELANLRTWWNSRHAFYHTFKMQQAHTYRLSNVG